MKKRTSFIAFFVALVLLCSCFFGCESFDGLVDDLIDQTNELSNGAPYELIYTSNGDGTCYVSEIVTRPNTSKHYTVEIPETSPDGDTVVGVVTVLASTLYRNLPKWILVEDFDAICNTAKANGMPDFDYAKMTANYLKLSIQGLDEQGKAQLIEAFPFTAYADFYVLDDNTSDAEKTKISQYLTRYAEFDEQKRYEADCKLLKILHENLPDETYYGNWHYTTFMQKIVLPATVRTVNLPTSAFAEIVYKGTTAQWAEVQCEVNRCLDTKVVCTDGEVALEKELVVQGESVRFFFGLTEDVVVKAPTEQNGKPLEEYRITLGGNMYIDEYLMLKSEYEELLVKMEQADLASKAQKYREDMVVYRVGSVEFVQVPFPLLWSDVFPQSDDFYAQAMLRVCKQINVVPNLMVENSKHFTGLELPATLKKVVIYIDSIENIYVKDIYFAGTIEQWKQVEIQNTGVLGADVSFITVHCTDGDLPLAATN